MHDLTDIKRLYANIGKLVTSSLDLEDILSGLMKEVNIFFAPHHWSLLRLDPQTEELFFIITQGMDLEQVKHIRMQSGEGIAGYVVKNRHSLCVRDVSQDPRFSKRIDQVTGFKTGSVLAVPIIYLDTVYGVIELVRAAHEKACYTEDDQLILETISDFAAISFANSTAFSLLIDLSEMDTLTGFYNQNRLEKYIAELENKAHHHRNSDQGLHVMVIFIDLDDFKAINDNFGHSKGDKVLREFSRRLRAAIRTNDKIFRIGGDEFLIILELESGHTVDAVSTRIRSQFEKINPFSAGNEVNVSFSVGIENGPCENLRQMIHDADMLMYQHKNRLKK